MSPDVLGQYPFTDEAKAQMQNYQMPDVNSLIASPLSSTKGDNEQARQRMGEVSGQIEQILATTGMDATQARQLVQSILSQNVNFVQTMKSQMSLPLQAHNTFHGVWKNSPFSDDKFAPYFLDDWNELKTMNPRIKDLEYQMEHYYNMYKTPTRSAEERFALLGQTSKRGLTDIPMGLRKYYKRVLRS